jgi:hypothetical protein
VARPIYLHGFASSPQSTKGQYFRQRFADLGRELELPELTQGDFEHSTLTQQLEFLDSLIGKQRAILIGSSLGGYLAALFAARNPERVPGVVLLAPAFGFARRWAESLGEDVVRQWRERGWRSVFHYGEKQQRRLSYDLLADGLQYEEFPEVRQPALVMHGRRDDAVDYRLSESLADGHANVELVLYDSDHELLNVLDPMWDRVLNFIERLET